MRRVSIVLGLLAFAILGLGGVDWAQTEGTTKEIVVFLPSAENPFWIEVRSGVGAEAAKLGGRYRVTTIATGDLDAASQIEQLNVVFDRRTANAVVIGL